MEAADQPQDSQLSQAPGPDAKKILIVEDDIFLKRPLVEKFIDEKFKVLDADDGKKGVEIALKEHPDIILLDLMLPIMDGIASLKAIRADEWGKDVPIIILTNVDSSEQVSEALEQGVNDYILKTSLTLDAVVAKVNDKLGAE